MLLFSVVAPGRDVSMKSLKMPPPAPAVLAATVALVSVSEPALYTPPPLLWTELPARVLFLTENEPALYTPPPLLWAELPDRVHSVTPPFPPTSLKMAPPLPALLPVKVQCPTPRK